MHPLDRHIWMIFSKFIHLCNHHHYPVLEHFHYSKKRPFVPFWCKSSTSIPSLRHPLMCFVKGALSLRLIWPHYWDSALLRTLASAYGNVNYSQPCVNNPPGIFFLVPLSWGSFLSLVDPHTQTSGLLRKSLKTPTCAQLSLLWCLPHTW